MSEEVQTSSELTSSPPAVILPAKSEDKLEIEKEEAETEPVESGTETGTGDETAEKKDSEDDKKTTEEAATGEADPAATAGDEPVSAEDEPKKRFKMPHVNLKAPKMPEFLRSKSKEREKNKDKAAEGEAEGETKEGEDKPEGEGAEAKKEGEEEEAPEEGSEAKGKDAKTRVKAAMDNIHMPKMPKMHKPAFLKKKKEESDNKEEVEGEDKKDPEEKKEGEEGAAEGQEDKDQGQDEDNKDKEDAAAAEEGAEEAEKDQKKSSILDNLKSMKNQVHMPAFLSKKSAKPAKEDQESGDKEESKELLEKKEGDGEDQGGDKKEGEDSEKKESEGKEGLEETETEESKGPSKAASLLESLRNVASHVPSMFKSKTKDQTTTDKEVDLEAGEKDELLEDKVKKVDTDGNELEEVKIVSGGEEGTGGGEGADGEKKDPEKPEKPYCKYLNHAKEAKTVCQQKYNALDRQKQKGILGFLAALGLLVFILILCAICTPTNWTNYARISEDGQYVVTHTTCGPIQGLVDGPDQFSFKRIPYAVPVINTDRWTHSKAMVTLADCHEGTLVAHSHNDSGSCWRRFPNGADGDENCLTLDIYTSSVVYDDLKPVVVYIDGDDLSQDEELELQPSASLAKNHSTVFVSVNYRRGVLGFLSLDSLSKRSIPKSSGNYGLGDLISALKWIKLNVQHFGGHPNQITLLGRGSGATMATILTASPMAKGLFKQAWVTNGAGAYENKTLSMANKENKAILQALNCGSDEAECLIDATADDLTDAMPYEWRATNQQELPQVGEKGHSWIIIDKHILLDHPKDFWLKHQLANKIPMVFGATAQGVVSVDNKEFMDWTDKNKYEAHVESKLGSFNVTIPGQAMSLYNMTDHWQEYSTMLSDIRTVCPIQELADYVSKNFVADVFSYVATQKKTSSSESNGGLGGIAEKTIDISAIFGTYKPKEVADNTQELDFIRNMQNLFYTFVKTGKLPMDKDLTLGMYIVDDKIVTQRNYPKCDFWKKAQNIVPTYANLN